MLGEDASKRIDAFKETEEDQRRAEQTVMHYYNWTNNESLRAADWSTWLWYHIVYRAERTAAVFTMAGEAGGASASAGSYGGWRLVRSRQQKWPAWMRQSPEDPPNARRDSDCELQAET